jgi:putative ABC transport system permease protein
MLSQLFSSKVALGFVQAGIAALLALVVVFLARRRQIHLESELAIALVRGLVQIVAVGSILLFMMRGPRWTGGILIIAMMIAAAMTSAKRAQKIPGAFEVSFYAILAGAGSVIALMTLAGVIGTAVTALVPVGSMLIANAMNTNGLALNRFRAELESHVGQIEAALALGAGAEVSVAPFSETSFRSSLIPAIDSLRALGIVWIPGLMAGMVLSGSPPIYAAIYQFVVLAMIFASSGLTALISASLIRTRAFSSAEQLLVRPAR